jgi:acetate kinase
VAESTPKTVLVVNAGSSSLKFALIDPDAGERTVEGLAERLGTPEATLHGTGLGRAVPGADHAAVLHQVLAELRERGALDGLVGVGHRIVHGGAGFSAPVRIDDAVLDEIRALIPLAPLHNPPGVAGVEAITEALPDALQVAVFDTAFHHGMPPVAYRYAVPEAWYRDHGVRRYGFHGISVQFVSGRTAELLDRPLHGLRLVVAHLGNGCSATAVRDGRSVDTTMGLTPLEGLVMGSRSGDVDPGVFGYLADVAGLDVHATTDALNHQGGLLGLSGVSNDMRTLIDAIDDGDDSAALALDVFVQRLAKAIAGLVVPLGRLDALVFTGGIGEHSAVVRAAVLGRLRFLGLGVDERCNEAHGWGSGGRISPPAAGAGRDPVALVVPTDEELLIARHTAAVARGA